VLVKRGLTIGGHENGVPLRCKKENIIKHPIAALLAVNCYLLSLPLAAQHRRHFALPRPGAGGTGAEASNWSAKLAAEVAAAQLAPVPSVGAGPVVGRCLGLS
jgi:hypothetical protein